MFIYIYMCIYTMHYSIKNRKHFRTRSKLRNIQKIITWWKMIADKKSKKHLKAWNLYFRNWYLYMVLYMVIDISIWLILYRDIRTQIDTRQIWKFLQTLRRSMAWSKIHTKMRFTAIERVNFYLQFAFLLSTVWFFFIVLLKRWSKSDHFCFNNLHKDSPWKSRVTVFWILLNFECILKCFLFFVK